MIYNPYMDNNVLHHFCLPSILAFSFLRYNLVPFFLLYILLLILLNTNIYYFHAYCLLLIHISILEMLVLYIHPSHFSFLKFFVLRLLLLSLLILLYILLFHLNINKHLRKELVHLLLSSNLFDIGMFVHHLLLLFVNLLLHIFHNLLLKIFYLDISLKFFYNFLLQMGLNMSLLL